MPTLLARIVVSTPRRARTIVRHSGSHLLVGVILLAFASSAMIACSKASGRPTIPSDGDPGLSAPDKKEIAMQLISAAENSSLHWRCQYRYIEYNVEGNEEDNRGYTAGIVGFTTKNGDLLEVVKRFEKLSPRNLLAKQMLEKLAGIKLNERQERLGEEFLEAWMKSDSGADREDFRAAQDFVRDEKYFNPAVCQAQCDGLRTLGQFIYYDAIVMHGLDPELKEAVSFDRIRADAMIAAKAPVDGGDESEYLNKFLDIRVKFMEGEKDHEDNIDRVENMQREFLKAKNFNLNSPLRFTVNCERFVVEGTHPE